MNIEHMAKRLVISLYPTNEEVAELIKWAYEHRNAEAITRKAKELLISLGNPREPYCIEIQQAMKSMHFALNNGFDQYGNGLPPVNEAVTLKEIDPVIIPRNFTTHRESWRKGLELARDLAPKSHNEREYWEHEIAAYDRSFDRLLGTTPKHDFWKDGDEWIPNAIRDRNGQVCLGMCKRCGRAEIELDEPCVPRSAHDDHVFAEYDMLKAITDKETGKSVPDFQGLPLKGAFSFKINPQQDFRALFTMDGATGRITIGDFVEPIEVAKLIQAEFDKTANSRYDEGRHAISRLYHLDLKVKEKLYMSIESAIDAAPKNDSLIYKRNEPKKALTPEMQKVYNDDYVEDAKHATELMAKEMKLKHEEMAKLKEAYAELQKQSEAHQNEKVELREQCRVLGNRLIRVQSALNAADFLSS